MMMMMMTPLVSRPPSREAKRKLNQNTRQRVAGNERMVGMGWDGREREPEMRFSTLEASRALLTCLRVLSHSSSSSSSPPKQIFLLTACFARSSEEKR